MSAYAAGTYIYFDDPNGAIDGIFRAGGTGTPVPLRVIKLTPVQQAQFGAVRVAVDAATFEIRVADVAAPAAGDTLSVSGILHHVQGAPVLDETGTVWLVDAAR